MRGPRSPLIPRSQGQSFTLPRRPTIPTGTFQSLRSPSVGPPPQTHPSRVYQSICFQLQFFISRHLLYRPDMLKLPSYPTGPQTPSYARHTLSSRQASQAPGTPSTRQPIASRTPSSTAQTPQAQTRQIQNTGQMSVESQPRRQQAQQ